jgi:outer membrane protein OmpA-like peptidoglycan-associated protein
MSLDLKTIWVVACLQLVTVLTAPAQNLVINGGFDDGNTCQEFTLPCGPAAWITLPVKTKVVFYGTDKKKETNRHFGLILENIKKPFDGRSYVETMLCEPLQAGRLYRLTMRCRTGPAPFERAGVLLTSDEIIDGIDTLSQLAPSFEITADSVQNKTDIKNWITVQYTFTAAGGEQFLALGNFSKTYSPRKSEYAYDGFGNIVLSVDDICLAPVQGTIPDIDTSCAMVKRRIYAQHLRHTPFMYLLGETKKTTAAPPAQVAKPAPDPDNATAVSAPPARRDTAAIVHKVYDTLLSVPFDVNSSLLDTGYTNALDSVLKKVLSGPYKNIIIVGHTDNTGPRALNKTLSVHRARSVATYFTVKGKIPAAKIRIAGMADGQPIASNDTPEGRQQNRRVEIIVHR